MSSLRSGTIRAKHTHGSPLTLGIPETSKPVGSAAQDGTCRRDEDSKPNQPDFLKTAKDLSDFDQPENRHGEARRISEPHQPVDHLRGAAERHIQNHQPESYSISQKIRNDLFAQEYPWKSKEYD